MLNHKRLLNQILQADQYIAERLLGNSMETLALDRQVIERMLYDLRHDIIAIRNLVQLQSDQKRKRKPVVSKQSGRPQIVIQSITGEEAGLSRVYFDLNLVPHIRWDVNCIHVLYSNQVDEAVRTSLGLVIGDEYVMALPLMILPPEMRLDQRTLPQTATVNVLNPEQAI